MSPNCHGTVQTAGTQVLGASGGQPERRAAQRGNGWVPGPAGNRTDGRADSRPGERPSKGTDGQPAAEQPGREMDGQPDGIPTEQGIRTGGLPAAEQPGRETDG